MGTAGLSIFPNWDSLSGAQSLKACSLHHTHTQTRQLSHAHRFCPPKERFFYGVKCLAVCANRPTRTDHTYLTHQQEQKFGPELFGHFFHKLSMTGSECAAVRPYHVQLTPQISMTNQFRNFLYSKVVLINLFVNTQHLFELPYILQCYRILDYDWSFAAFSGLIFPKISSSIASHHVLLFVS